MDVDGSKILEVGLGLASFDDEDADPLGTRVWALFFGELYVAEVIVSSEDCRTGFRRRPPRPVSVWDAVPWLTWSAPTAPNL
jgi:hypothetical protein